MIQVMMCLEFLKVHLEEPRINLQDKHSAISIRHSAFEHNNLLSFADDQFNSYVTPSKLIPALV